MSFLPDSEIKYLDTMIDDGQYDDAIDYINNFLANDPTNQELLLMIADIQYKK